ncbi:MAG: hypothetical protein ACI37R_02945 [Candidatus Avigastranaerophilus sp.]
MKYNKIIITIISAALFLTVLYFIFYTGQYFYLRHKAMGHIDEVYKKYNDICSIDRKVYPVNEDYYLMHHLILPELLLYDAKYNNKPLTYITQSNPIHYTFPEEILKASDYIFSYGVDDRMYWEEIISEYYKKPVYAFDCGVNFPESAIKSRYLTFCSECIGTDEFILYNQISSGKIHSVRSKLEELNIQDKKVYLRFGIPELHRVMPDVLKSKDNITGITFLIDLWSPSYIIETLKMLEMINKDFVLVSRNFLYPRDEKLQNGKIKYTDGNWSIMLDLTFVNKNMLSDYYLPYNQSSYKHGLPESYISFHVKSYRKDGILKNVDKYNHTVGYYKYNNISPIVVLHKKISRLLNKAPKA